MSIKSYRTKFKRCVDDCIPSYLQEESYFCNSKHSQETNRALMEIREAITEINNRIRDSKSEITYRDQSIEHYLKTVGELRNDIEHLDSAISTLNDARDELLNNLENVKAMCDDLRESDAAKKDEIKKNISLVEKTIKAYQTALECDLKVIAPDIYVLSFFEENCRIKGSIKLMLRKSDKKWTIVEILPYTQECMKLDAEFGRTQDTQKLIAGLEKIFRQDL